MFDWKLAGRQWRDLALVAGLSAAAALSVYYLQQQLNPVAYQFVTADAWFDADIPRVFANLTDRHSDHYRTAAHPLISLLTYPAVRALAALFGLEGVTAVRVQVAVAAGIWMATLYLLLRLVSSRRLDAALFSLVAASSAAALFWLTVPETYVFGSTSVMVALLFAVLAGRRPSPLEQWLPLEWWAVAASAVSLSMTITNWMAGLIVAAVRFPWQRAAQISLNALAVVALLWSAQKAIFPSAEFFLGSLAEDRQFLLTERSGGPLAVARSFFLHTMSMPEPVHVSRHQGVPPYPTLMLTQPATAGSGGIWGAVAIMLWVGLLGFGVMGLVEMKRERSLRLALALILLGQLALHLVYGSETFAYSLHFLPLLALLATMGTETGERRMVRVMAALLIVAAGTNNYRQLRQAMAYFDDPVVALVAQTTSLPLAGEERPSARERVLGEMARRPNDPWPRGRGHVILAIPGSSELEKGYYEPGGSFSPAAGTFGLSLWVLNGEGELLTTSDDLQLAAVEQEFVWPEGAKWPGIAARTPYYEATWLPVEPGLWQLEIRPTAGAAGQIALTVRSVGPAGGPVNDLSWDGRLLVVNGRWQISAPAATTVQMGREGEGDWLETAVTESAWQGDDGWGYARLSFAGEETVRVAVGQEGSGFAAGADIPRTSDVLQLDLPDEALAEALDAQVAHLLMSLVGNETRPGDPLNYPLTWQRDAAYIIVALARVGQVEQASELSHYVAEIDFFGGFGAEADAPGLGIWALNEVALHLGDADYERQMWPHVARKAGLIERMLALDRPFYHEFAGPVVPQLAGNPVAGLVADPARDGLIIGRMDHHRPLLYVNAISYRGLRDAAALAERLGFGEEADRWQTAADSLQQAWEAALQTAEAENQRTYTSSVWPSWVAAANNMGALENRLEERWQRLRTADGGFRERPLWTYFEVGEAHQWLYLGRPERVWPTLAWFWDNQVAPGLYTWWEGNTEENTFHQWEKVRGWVEPPHVTPHYWTTAEMALLLLDLLAYTTADGRVVIGGGAPESWLERPIHAGPLPIATGSVEWWWDGQALTVRVVGGAVEVAPGPAFADVPLRVER